MKTMLRGVFLTCERPEETARFYEQVAALPLERVGVEGQYVYWRIDQGAMQLAIHDARTFADYTYPPEAASNLTHLYFKIDDQQAFLDHLEALGMTPLAQDEVVITVVDPDGRKVMFGTA